MAHQIKLQPFQPTAVRMTAAEITAAQTAGTLPVAGITIHVVDGNGVFQEAKMSAGSSATPTLTGGGSSTNWEKVQITTSNYALKPSGEGRNRVFHVETGGTLKELVVADWPIPTSGVQVFYIQNHTTTAKTFSINIGAGQFSGLVDFDGNEIEDNSFSIKKNTEAKITIDQDGWVQVAASGSTYTKPEIDTLFDTKAPLASPAFTGTPTGITKAHVGLTNVDNTADTAKPVSTAQQTSLNLKAPLASPAFTGTPTGITKSHVGLANVDNTADTAKPVSTAQQTALDAKQATLTAGTTIKNVNGTSLLGSGNITTSADLDGGTNTTILNEGLATTGTPTIDTTTAPGETIIRWTGAGSFTVPLGVTSVRALVVGPGGGGGGGESNSFGGAGGGGAGGRVRDILGHVVTPSAVLTVTVPAGGGGGTSAVGDTSTSGATGAGSVFGSLTAEGGGGGHGDANSPVDTGYNGGGGSGDNGGGGLAGGIGSGGFAGGAGHASGRGGGGGGGAGAVGEAANTDGARQGGDGGLGVDSDITGATVRYGSGAGGAANSNGGSVAGGTGDSGAGDGDTSAPNNTGAGTLGSAGVANRGGGGGGGCGRNGFAGGSGVVIVRFATQSRTYKALQAYADNAAALTAGRKVGEFYKKTADGSVQQVV